MAPLEYPLDTIKSVTRFHMRSSLRRIARSCIHIEEIEELIQRTDDAIKKSRAFISRSDVVSKQVWEIMTGGPSTASESGEVPMFIRTIAEAAIIADLPHYNLLRTVLLELK